MKFVIRDDDLNYFSKPGDIKCWYTDILEQDIPVNFSTIPFVKGTSDVYPSNGDSREFPISENKELIDYVKSNRFIEILQHGSTHETVNGMYEYAQDRDLTGDTLRGKEELKRAFGQEINVFVPPHDWINRCGIISIEKAELHIIRGRGTGIRNLKFSIKYFKNLLILLWDPLYPFILDFGRHKEMRSFRLEDANIWEGLDHAYKKDGIFVVVTHLHNFTQEKKDTLLKLIAKAKEYGAEFISPNKIFS